MNPKTDLWAVPLGLDEVNLGVKVEAAVYLLADQAEGAAQRQLERHEQVSQELLESQPSLLRVQAGQFHQPGDERLSGRLGQDPWATTPARPSPARRNSSEKPDQAGRVF